MFIALSGLHTRETVQYKRLLQDLKIGHTSGLEKHVYVTSHGYSCSPGPYLASVSRTAHI